MPPDSPPPITLSPSQGRRAYRRLRVPAFYPVPTRTRRDGWTVERQSDFIGLLAETGSVIGACEAVGTSRKSATGCARCRAPEASRRRGTRRSGGCRPVLGLTFA